MFFFISPAKLRVFDEVTSDGVWKSLIAKKRWLTHSETIVYKPKCYMSEKKWCGKVIDVTSNLDGFIPKKRRKRYKNGEGEKLIFYKI